MKLSPYEIAYLVLQAGFSEQEAPIMVAIILAESGGDTDYLEMGNEQDQLHGLARISSRLHSDKLQNWRNPKKHMEMARVIYQRGGFSNWESYNINAYKTFLVIAHEATENPIRPPIDVATIVEKIDNSVTTVLQFALDIRKQLDDVTNSFSQMSAIQNSIKKSVEQIRSKFS